MNNNCDQDDFCACDCCEEFYDEEEPTVETNLTLLLEEARLEAAYADLELAEANVALSVAAKEFLTQQTAMMKELMEIIRELKSRVSSPEDK